MSSNDERKILCVGLLCADLLVLAKDYPLEDTDSRTISQKWQRGGNASNNCTVLSYLNAPCELLATINDSSDLDEEAFLTQNLPELCFEEFKKLQLVKYKWIHFEGRSPAEYARMLNHVNEWNRSHPYNETITVSLELEKPQLDFKELSHLADILFISKDLAISLGHRCKEDAVKGFNTNLKSGAIVICPWGEDGVSASLGDGCIISVDAYCPPKIIDTLGAGDTFIAAVIFAMANGSDTKSSLAFGCRLAGEKCGMFGHFGIKDLANKLYEDMAVRHTQNIEK